MNQDNKIYAGILSSVRAGKKMFGVLIDPDKQNDTELIEVIKICNNFSVDFFLVGGSIIREGDLNETTRLIKENTSKPVILFPGSPDQISDNADAILFLSLISGKNPTYLIESQVYAAPLIRKTSLEVIPTGYLLVDCGNQTTAISVSDTEPIMYDQIQNAANTALAGEYLGMKITYIDGGSGAKKNISPDMIKQTKKMLSTPLIIGGGIKTAKAAHEVYEAGADIIVVGNGVEENNNLIAEITKKKDEINTH